MIGILSAQEEALDKEKQKEILSTLKIADGLYRMDRYHSVARDFYKRVLIADPHNVYATYRLAQTCRYLKYYEDAQKWYAKVVMMDEGKYPQAKLYYAEMSQAVDDYKLALGLYYQFLEEEDLAGPLIDIANLGIASCNYALDASKVYNHPDSTNIGIARLTTGINGLRSEFGFSMYGDKFLYTGTDRVYAKKNIKYPKDQIDAPIKMHYDTSNVNRIFVTEKDDESFTEGEIMHFKPDKEFAHYGSPTFSSDSLTMYITFGAVDHKHGDFFRIYKRHKKNNGEGGALEKLKGRINKKKFSYKHPSVVKYAGSDALLFSSNQPGGYGNYDLYIGLFDKEGRVSDLINLGASINTRNNEVTPFYDVNQGLLYFSSNGHIGFGQLDIYKIPGQLDEDWGLLENLGLPYNSGADDFYYTRMHNGKEYLSTNRSKENTIDNSTCCYDIYSTGRDTISKAKDENYIVHLNIYDKLTRGEVTGSNISIIDSRTNNLLESIKSEPGTKLFVHLPEESDYIIRIENKKGDFEIKNLRVSTVGKPAADSIQNDVYLRTSLTDEEKAFEFILDHYCNIPFLELDFRVQVGAYSKAKMEIFDKFEFKFPVKELTHNKLYKYISGLEKVACNIETLRQEIVTTGVPDAFVVAYYKGERILMNEAKYLLSTVAND